MVPLSVPDTVPIRRIALALLLLATACEPSGPGAPPALRSPSGDTLLVQNTLESLPDTATLEEIWRVPLDSVTALAWDGAGGILAARRSQGIVRVGRNGGSPSLAASLPSERISGVAALPGGEILVRDEEVGALIRFSPSGEPVATAPLPEGREVYGGDALQVDRNGTIWLAIGARFPSDAEPVAYPRPVYVGLDESLLPVDSLLVPSHFVEACPTRSQAHFSSGHFEDFRVRYYPMVKWRLHHGGYLVAGCPREYAFDVLAPGGKVLRISKPWTPQETSWEERFSFQSAWTAQMKFSGRYQQWGWLGSEVPPQKPAYHALFPTPDGRFWVWPTGATVKTPSPPTWPLAGLPDTLWAEPGSGTFDVFDADGDLVGQVRFPEEVGYSPLLGRVDPVILGDTIWALVPRLEGGGEELARFRVAWGKRRR